MGFSKVLIVLAASALVLAGCGSVPVPKTGKAGTEVQAKSSAKPAKGKTRPQRGTQPEAVVVEKAPRPALDSATAYWKRAVTALQVGEVMNARADLEAALRLDPGNKIATNLLAQLDADAVAELGNENFSYKITSGDSLSGLARDHLGDPLKFYILAKYNGIDNPSRLRIGETIKIPGKAPAPKPVMAKPQPPAAPANPAYAKAKKWFDQGEYAQAVATLEAEVEGTLEAQVDSQQMQELLVLSYGRLATKYRDEGKLVQAQEVLQKATILQPTNEKLASRLDAIGNQLEAERHYRAGVQAQENGDPVAAYEGFHAALEADAGHEGAQQGLAGLKPELVDHFYKEAMIAYRRQKLQEAISGWDRVLELDPDHENAKLYRARALELKEKLETFANQ